MQAILRSLGFAALVVVATVPTKMLGAQGAREKVPLRPAMADSNSADGYYRYGVSMLRKRPLEAADALYWAIRLDPSNAQAYTARRIALMVQDKDRLWRYLDWDPGVRRSERTYSIDSLELIARVRDPFMHRRLDLELLDPFVGSWNDLTAEASAGFRGWVEYTRGNFPQALKLYSTAVKQGKYGWQWRIDRAQTWYLVRQYDSTVTELTQYLAQQRKNEKDEKRFQAVYDSKAMTEYMIGMAYIAKGDLPNAREALGRALMEDLSFYMAHARLGAVAAASGDTATALAEYDLAAQAGARDASVINDYGIMLLLAGKKTESEEQFRKALALEPYYADVYFNLAQALDLQGKRDDARKYYSEYVVRTAKTDDRIPYAQERIGALKGSD